MNDGDQDVNDINNELIMKKEELTSGGGLIMWQTSHSVFYMDYFISPSHQTCENQYCSHSRGN